MQCKDHGYKGSGRGYANVALNGKYIGRHVVALIQYTGEQPEGRVAMHVCDNPRCIEPTHLRWGTQRDNMRDKVAKGRHHNGTSKSVDIAEARRLRADGLTFQEVADIYGVSRQAVHSLLKQNA